MSPLTAPTLSSEALYAEALAAAQSGHAEQAELACSRALDANPAHLAATLLAARLATARNAYAQAVSVLQSGARHHPDDEELSLQLSLALAAAGDVAPAQQSLEQLLYRAPHLHDAWLVLSMLRAQRHDASGALQAAYQAVTRAQRAGKWLDESTTPKNLLTPVMAAINRVRVGRKELLLSSFAELRHQHGGAQLARMDLALRAYLKEEDCKPSDTMQRPRFLYFPGLPDAPYHDPHLQSWATRLQEAFPLIRQEALSVLDERGLAIPDFVPAPPPGAPNPHLGGAATAPRWQAYFFYRRGRRFDENHQRCPQTSALLESIDLCRIADQAPEICFSILQPQTHIKPHHGVTNTRLVMHLPLLVPPDCALNLVDRGTHVWQEGVLTMFDDTYLHEAWNRSDRPRVILLMDCWNPHLTAVERQATQQLVEMIGSLSPSTASAGQGH